MLPQRGHGLPAQFARAAGTGRLGLAERQPADPLALQRAADDQRAGVEFEVAPLEAERFPSRIPDVTASA